MNRLSLNSIYFLVFLDTAFPFLFLDSMTLCHCRYILQIICAYGGFLLLADIALSMSPVLAVHQGND